MPEGDLAADDESAEHERRDHRRALRDEKEAASLDSIGDGASKQGEREDRRRTEHAAETEQERRIGELVEQPGRRGELDPSARHGHELAHPVERVVAVPEGRESRRDADHALNADGTGEYDGARRPCRARPSE